MVSNLSNSGIHVYGKGHNYLLNRHLKVAAWPWSPYIKFFCNEKEIEGAYDCPDKGNMTYGGILWEFLNMVKLARNVTVSILSPPTPTWGYCHGVNNCTGMIGMVNRREVDFALGIFTNHLTMTNIISKKKYFPRSFHSNPQQGTSCRIYNTNWCNGILHHNCSTEVRGQLVVTHRSFVIRSLDLFPDLHTNIYRGIDLNELFL